MDGLVVECNACSPWPRPSCSYDVHSLKATQVRPESFVRTVVGIAALSEIIFSAIQAIVIPVINKYRGIIDIHNHPMQQNCSTICVSFRPPDPELRRAYEVVWGGPLHRRNFQRKVLSSEGFLERTGKQRTGTGGPQADLYKTGKVTRLHPEMLRGSLLLDTGPARRLSSI